MRLIVSPLPYVKSAIRTYRPARMISLMSPGAVSVPFEGPRLDLRFHDVSAPRPGMTPPDGTMITALLDAAADLSADTPVLLHCWAGISRSPAAAFILACARTRPGVEAALAAQLRQMSPAATPNPLMVALADERLDRRGAMVAAIAALGRGRDAFWGDLFVLATEA